MPKPQQQNHPLAVARVVSRLRRRYCRWLRLVVIDRVLEAVVEDQALPLLPRSLLSTTDDPRFAAAENQREVTGQAKV